MIKFRFIWAKFVLLVTFLSGLLLACQTAISPDIKQELTKLPPRVDYNFHVRPILSEHCFSCHGPDEKKQKGGLRLDLPGIAKKRLEESGRVAIVPHRPKQSEAFHRLLSNDPEYQMPPPEAKVPLNILQKAILIKWLEQGAEYQPHWAFVKPTLPDIPKVSATEWAINEIDHFVLNRLEKEQLSPSSKASKETLIRRLAFDLTGMPPTVRQIDAFLADKSPDAYQRVVNRFLTSKAYGERMAAYWMDIARYADSDGYLDDKHRDFSPWRDWVIQAFNDNMPYDEFVTYQIAGDLLPNAGKAQIIPTAFNRLHKKNSEAGIDLEEFRVEYVADKTNTFGKAFMGLTLECARCHSHKYDPISQEDYYSLFAFFNQTDEIGHAVYGPDITPGPSLLLTEKEVEKKLDFINQKIKQQEEEVLAYRKAFFQQENEKPFIEINKQLVTNQLQNKLLAHYPFDEVRVTDKNRRGTSPNLTDPKTPARINESVFKRGVKGNALFNTDYSSAILGEKVGWFERTQPFSLDFWIYPERDYEEASVFLHCEDWRLGYKGYSLHLDNNRLKFLMAHAHPQNAIQVQSEERLVPKKWAHIALTYDGSSKAEGVKLFINGQPANTEVIRDNLYKGILYEPNIHTYGFQGVKLGKHDGVLPMDGGGIDELRFFKGALTHFEVLYLHKAESLNTITDQSASNSQLIGEWTLSHQKQWQERQQSLEKSRSQLNDLLNSIPEIMVMKDLPTARPTFVLNRGNFDSPGKRVNFKTPKSILPFSEDFPTNRLGLSQWLFHPDHPLTARVMVNRIWEMHFGKGLVKTQEDFGNQGALPSHPELLDWLAIKFQQSGWDIKALHHLIVSSAIYQQSSEFSEETMKKDPENFLLSRGSSFRLSAEMIRDNALAISGLLVNKIGGPSVYPYQPEGLWDEISNKSWRYPYLQQPGEGLYRRSLYTIWKRTAPPPSMLLFDANDRSNCTVQRKVTSTPLQALVLLNDPQYIEAARVLAENTIGLFEQLDNQITHLFRAITGRLPEKMELAVLTELYQKEKRHFEVNQASALEYLNVGEMKKTLNIDLEELAALSVVANALFNTDEAYTRR